MKQICVFLASHNDLIRQGLRLLIDSQPDMHVVGEADDDQDGWLQAKEMQPDVVVFIDHFIPGEAGTPPGAQTTAHLKQIFPEARVLALTGQGDVGYLRQLLRAGASGYVLKRAAAEEFTRAIRIMALGGICLGPILHSQVTHHYNPQPHVSVDQISVGQTSVDQTRSEEPEPQAELSDREREVLCLTAEGYSNREIATRPHISVKTVETYKIRIRGKLDLNSRSSMVSYALRRGWLRA